MKTFVELLEKVDTSNNLSSTPYDTAWIVRLKDRATDPDNQTLQFCIWRRLILIRILDSQKG